MKSYHKGETGLLIAASVCMAAAFLSVAALAARADKTDAASLPGCADTETLTALRESLDAGDVLRVLGVHSARELTVSESGDLRTCMVGVVTDHGDRLTTYMIGWEDRDAGVTFIAGEPLE